MSTSAANSTGVVIKGQKKVASWLKKQRQDSEKAMNTGIKVEAFRLKKLLQTQLRQGKAGADTFDSLSFISKRLTRRPNRKPLAKLALGVRYRVACRDPFRVEMGFVSTVSESFRHLAERHQRGFSKVISEKQLSFIIGRGASLGRIEGGDTPFFLTKNTRIFTTPARPIIDPFWQANHNKAMANIRKNFKAKLKGKRI